MHSIVLIISVNVVFAGCVRINLGETQTVKVHRRTELKPVIIECQLTDMIIISAPIVKAKEVIYYLNKPNGDITKLDLSLSIKDNEKHNFTQINEYDNIVADFIENQPTILNHEDKYTVFNVNLGQTITSDDVFKEKLNSMLANEFIVGPLDYDDHGNWMLSLYYRDGLKWVEVYQVISILIIQPTAALPRYANLKTGETFELMFAYPIPHLESCQLTAPISTFDRFYDRNEIRLNQCTYVVSNVTTQDSGRWKIIGVGKIVYEAFVDLKVSPMN